MDGRFRFPRLGVFATVLALAAQLAVGATVPRPLAGFGYGVICHADAPPGTPGQHHAPLPMRCPLCAALATPTPLIASAPLLVRSARIFFPFAAPPPPATGPPVRFVIAARPRGPPPLA